MRYLIIIGAHATTGKRIEGRRLPATAANRARLEAHMAKLQRRYPEFTIWIEEVES